MMLDSAVVPGPPGLDEEIEGGLVSLVGLTGPWSGTGSFCCSPAVAGRLAARMLMMDPPPEEAAVTDEIMDAIAELTNMIVGNIKNFLEERVGPMAINIPTVVYGRNFQFKSLAGMTGISIPFAWESDRIEVRLCLAPTAEKSHFLRARAEAYFLQKA
ncbi:MAG: putative chemotaxis protein CheX [Bryobacterales bacterium]|nr:putative chemotaxis protein CheX [Bryobacterales bacterium]